MSNENAQKTMKLPIEVHVHGKDALFMRMFGGTAVGENFKAHISTDLTGSKLILSMHKEGKPLFTVVITAHTFTDAVLEHEAEIRALVEPIDAPQAEV